MSDDPPLHTVKTAPSESELDGIEKLIAAKKNEQALSALRPLWLADPENRRIVSLMSKLMKAQGKSELAGSLYKLSETAEALTHDVQNLFEAGFKLIDERELYLAIMLLSRCVDKLPSQAVVSYEYAFALMAVRRFADALPYFERSLAIEENFDTRLNLTVCYTMTRQLEKAQLALVATQKLAKKDEEKKEVVLRQFSLKRLEQLKAKSTLSSRDWLYIMYGSIILSEPLGRAGRALDQLAMDTAGKSGAAAPDYSEVAWTLLVLSKLLCELGMEFDVVEFYSPLSRPLAEALAHIMELPVQGYRGPGRADRALLVMAWARNIIGPHKSFIPHSNKRTLFAYGLPPTEGLPLTPEIVGELVSDCIMPWAPSSDEEAERRSGARLDLPDEQQAQASDHILKEIAELESKPEIIQTVEELVAYYKSKRELLVMGNAASFPQRPEYTAEILS
jgi:tetratricopeptide (TPR) repeat protein